MSRFETISMNDDAGVSSEIRQGGVRQKLAKDGHSRRAELFCPASALLGAYIPQWVCHAPRALNQVKIASAITSKLIEQSTQPNGFGISESVRKHYLSGDKSV